MITITDTNNIQAAIEKFKPDARGAYSTDRCLPGQYEQVNCEEWAERGKINGTPAKVYYVFDCTKDGIDGDPETYPWDDEHITKIEIAEKDENGEYESI